LPGETQDYFGILTHLMKQFVISSEARGLKTYSFTVSERSEHGGIILLSLKNFLYKQTNQSFNFLTYKPSFSISRILFLISS